MKNDKHNKSVKPTFVYPMEVVEEPERNKLLITLHTRRYMEYFSPERGEYGIVNARAEKVIVILRY